MAKPKAKKINLNLRQQWKAILSTVTKEEVPVQMLESLSVNLIDGTKVNVNVCELIAEGREPHEIEQHINKRLSSLNDMIKNVDFFINIDSVVAIVQPLTDRLLSRA